MGWGKSAKDLGALAVKGILGAMFKRMETPATGDWSRDVGLVIQSDQETEVYKWLGQFPSFRRWVGERLRRGGQKYRWQIENELFELTLEFDENDWNFDKLGQIKARTGEVGRRGGMHWMQLLSELINTNGACYDTTSFFGTAHTFKGNPNTYKNTLTSVDVAALNAGNPQAPTEDEYRDVLMGVIPWVYSYKDENLQPVNEGANQFLLMVPTNHLAAARAAKNNMFGRTGGSNSLDVQDWNITVVPNARLSSTTKGYLFRTDSEIKAFLLQNAVDVRLKFLGADSEHNFHSHGFLLGADCTRAAGYGEWSHALEFEFN